MNQEEFNKKFKKKLNMYLSLLNNIHKDSRFYTYYPKDGIDEEKQKTVMHLLMYSYDKVNNLLMYQMELIDLLKEKFGDALNEEI